MPTKKTFTKEKIVEEGINLIRELGYGSLSVRNIAKRMNSSVQPVFYSFSNFENLKSEIAEAAFLICRSYIEKKPKYEDKPYLAVGMNFIEFAYKEKNLFKFLFDNKDVSFEDLNSYKIYYDETVEKVEKTAKVNQKLGNSIHEIVGISTIGLAVLIANEKVNYDEIEIEKFLGAVFKGQILYQKDEEDEHNRDKKFKEVLQRSSSSK